MDTRLAKLIRVICLYQKPSIVIENFGFNSYHIWNL